MGNRLSHSDGIATATCDQKFNICHEGANTAGLFNGALESSVRIVDNSLSNGAGITVKGTVLGAVVESNRLVNGSTSFSNASVIVNQSFASHVTLRNNSGE